MDVFSEKVTIPFSRCDGSDTLSAASAVDLFQGAADCHAVILGLGRDDLLKSGQGWVLSRLSVYLKRRPRYGETVTVRSWPRGAHKLFAVRDYDIIDAAGEPIAAGRSGWLILDLEKRRPLRPQAAVEKLPLNEDRNALPAGEAGIEAPPALNARPAYPVTVSREARYSDLDYNGHVNNARYVEWVQDLMEEGFLEAARELRLDINYLQEVRFGETITLGLDSLQGSEILLEFANRPGFPVSPASFYAIEGRRSPDQPAFRAELILGQLR